MGEHSLKKSEAPRSLPRREKIQIALQINFCYRDGWYGKLRILVESRPRQSVPTVGESKGSS